MCKKIIEEIEKNKIIVILRGVEKEKIIPLAEALYAGGIRAIECTFDAKGLIADDETAEKISLLANHFGKKMLIGAGTVLKEKQVELTKKAGGCFVISPDTNPSVIAASKKYGLVSIPGALTPSEAVTAHNAGADFVKLFPTDALGAGYIKSISAPLSHIKFLAVGGVSSENMKEFFQAGAVGVGIGSSIINKQMIKENDFAGITSLAESYTNQL